MKTSFTRGFTLVELLVVIAIIAILGSMLLPALAGGKVAVRKSLCLNNQKQIFLSTKMYSDDHDGRFPTADTSDHTLWIKRMVSTKNFSTLKIFEDPAESEGGNNFTHLRKFSFILNGKTNDFIGSYGINERVAGPAGIQYTRYDSVKQPDLIFFFGCATYFIAPDWDHERVYNAGGPQPIGATVNPPIKKYARHGSGMGGKPGSVITYIDGHGEFKTQAHIQTKLHWFLPP